MHRQLIEQELDRQWEQSRRLRLMFWVAVGLLGLNAVYWFIVRAITERQPKAQPASGFEVIIDRTTGAD